MVQKARKTYSKNRQTGKSNKRMDASRKAKPPGKRQGKTGPYYEYRKNRSDKKGKRV